MSLVKKYMVTQRKPEEKNGIFQNQRLIRPGKTTDITTTDKGIQYKMKPVNSCSKFHAKELSKIWCNMVQYDADNNSLVWFGLV